MIKFINNRLIWRHFFWPAVLFLCVLLVPQIRRLFLDFGWRWVYVLFLSFAISFCLTPVSGWLAKRLDIIDRPAERKPHHSATPLLGGAAVFIAFFAALMINGIYSLKLSAILAAVGTGVGVGGCGVAVGTGVGVGSTGIGVGVRSGISFQKVIRSCAALRNSSSRVE